MPSQKHPTVQTAVLDPSNCKTALLRSLGLIIDCFFLAMLFLLPTFFRAATDPGSNIGQGCVLIFGRAISQLDAPAAIGQFLLLTPLPLIYLRLSFKWFYGWNTPGETITKISSRSYKHGFVGLALECFYGLVQYVALFFSVVFGAAVGLCFICLMNFAPHLVAESSLGRVALMLVLISPIPLSMLMFLTLLYWPGATDDRASSIDQCCGHMVERIDREDRNSLVVPDS